MAGRDSEKIILILLVAVVILVGAGVFSMIAMMRGYWGAYGIMGGGMMGWMGNGSWMSLWGLVFLIILIAGLYLIFSGSGKPQQQLSTGAMEILKERYAKGEITSEEYSRMKKELET